MNKYKVFSKMWFLALLLVAFVAGCASNGGDPGTLVSIKVTPATASIPVTGTLQYMVAAIYGDGSSRDVTATSTMTTGTAGVMLTPPGLATGVTASVIPVVITATFGGKTATANLTVNAATSTKFEVTPFGVTPSPLVSIPVTATQQYTAIETFSNGSTFDRTTLSTWTSPDLVGSGVANVSTTGLATGVTIGKSTITAKYNGQTATAILTVNAATSVSLRVTPDLASIPVTGTQQYKAIEIFSDGSTFDRTTLSTWNSASTGVATFASSLPATGIATGIAAGTSNITATFGGKTTTPAAKLTVTSAKVLSIAVTPVTSTILVNGKQQFKAVAQLDDGSLLDVTTNPATTWASANFPLGGAVVASILPSGVATGLILGQSDITATFSLKTSPAARLTVIAPLVLSIAVTPLTATIPVNGTQQFRANAQLNDGSFLDVTTDPTTIWASADVAPGVGVASLSLSGVGAGAATGLNAGQSDITATFSGKTSPAARLTVTAIPVNPPVLAINLRSAATFGIASRAGMTSTGVTVVNGNIALSPTPTCTDATGGPGGASQSCLSKAYASATGMTVNGSIFWATDAEVPPGATASSVVSDLNLAWIEGKLKPNTQAVGFLGGELGAPRPGGKTILPGTYAEGATLLLSAGNLAILSGSATDVWIFKVGTSFTDSGILTNPTEIKLVGGALARNVWFVTGASATIGSGTLWNGNILAGSTVTINSSSTVIGRVLSGADLSGGLLTLTNTVAPPALPTTITVPQ